VVGGLEWTASSAIELLCGSACGAIGEQQRASASSVGQPVQVLPVKSPRFYHKLYRASLMLAKAMKRAPASKFENAPPGGKLSREFYARGRKVYTELFDMCSVTTVRQTDLLIA
jgi:hypothetical protein